MAQSASVMDFSCLVGTDLDRVLLRELSSDAVVSLAVMGKTTQLALGC